MARRGRGPDARWLLDTPSHFDTHLERLDVRDIGNGCRLWQGCPAVFHDVDPLDPPMGICVWVIAWFGVALALDFTKAASLGDSQVTYSPREQ